MSDIIIFGVKIYSNKPIWKVGSAVKIYVHFYSGQING